MCPLSGCGLTSLTGYCAICLLAALDPISRAGLVGRAYPIGRASLVSRAYPISRANPISRASLVSRANPISRGSLVSRAGLVSHANPISRTSLISHANPISRTSLISHANPISRTGLASHANPIDRTSLVSPAGLVSRADPAEPIGECGLVGACVLVSGCGRSGPVGRMDLAVLSVLGGCELPTAGNDHARHLNRRPLRVGRLGHQDQGPWRRAVAGAVGWWGDVTVDPQVHHPAAVALSQTPFTMPFMLPAELITLGRVIARRTPVPPARQLRPGEEFELRHKPFSRIRWDECQPYRRVDHANPARRREHLIPGSFARLTDADFAVIRPWRPERSHAMIGLILQPGIVMSTPIDGLRTHWVSC